MIDILMAVYNGERFLAEQLDSILAQSVSSWRLIAQDDCSTDKTMEILNSYASRYPGRIIVRQTPRNTGGAMGNFASLITMADAPYVMTCDHDDVWKPDKIEKTWRRMRQLEETFGANTPLLVHTDLCVTDDQLRVLSPSMFARQGLDSERDYLTALLAQNIVTGCTMMANRALCMRAGEIPPEAIMHDWWYALTASAFGKIGFVEEPTIYYRQHGANEVGAKAARSPTYLLSRLFSPGRSRAVLADTYRQADAFAARFGEDMRPEDRAAVQAYASMPQMGKLRRIKTLRKYKLMKKGLTRAAGQLLFC